MRTIRFPALVVLLALVAWAPACDRTPAPPLDVLWPVPAFSLTDQTGATVTRADLEGRVWVADFFFTSCPAICPLLTRSMGQVRDAVPDAMAAGDAALVGFTLQPEHDTPEVLADYGRSHGAAPGQWYLLTGPRETIWQISQEGGFKLAVYATDTPNNPIGHDGRLSLVDRRGRVRGVYDGLDPDAVQTLIRDLKRLLADASL